MDTREQRVAANEATWRDDDLAPLPLLAKRSGAQRFYETCITVGAGSF
jgi:hypothetical protein